MPSANPMTDAAIARVELSLKDKPVGPKSYTMNIAEDILVICALVEKPDGIVKSLLLGATNAERPGSECWQDTDHVRHVLKCAKG